MDFSKYKNQYDYQTQRSLYDKREAERHEQFYQDSLKTVGLWGHPKASKVYSYAWEKGHSAGFQEVYYYLYDLAELVR